MNPGDRFAAVRGGFLRRGLYRTNRLRDFGILSYSADLRPGGRIWLSRPLEWLVCVLTKILKYNAWPRVVVAIAIGAPRLGSSLGKIEPSIKIAPGIADAWARQEPSASKKEKHMPLVRINLSRTASPKLR